MRRTERSTCAGFTLFEVLIALAVFMLAVVGIAKALDTALDAALEARQRTQCRHQLESRLAYCLAAPPQEGSPRILSAEQNNGVRVEESLAPYAAKNAKGRDLQGLKILRIVTKSGSQTESAEIILNHQ
jgi:Tfp pilus assembly protein PilV